MVLHSEPDLQLKSGQSLQAELDKVQALGTEVQTQRPASAAADKTRKLHADLSASRASLQAAQHRSQQLAQDLLDTCNKNQVHDVFLQGCLNVTCSMQAAARMQLSFQACLHGCDQNPLLQGLEAELKALKSQVSSAAELQQQLRDVEQAMVGMAQALLIPVTPQVNAR